jgi:hypothetical protein
MEQGLIRGGEGVRCQPGGINPFERGTTERLRLADEEIGEKELQSHGLVRVGVGEVGEERAGAGGNAKFFVEFALEALLEGFSGFAFAAGEFPEAAKVRFGRALRDEEFAGAKDERGADFDQGSRAGIHRPMLL